MSVVMWVGDRFQLNVVKVIVHRFSQAPHNTSV